MEVKEKEIVVPQTQVRKREVKFKKGDVVYIFMRIEGLGEDFFKHTFDMRVGHNLYFKRQTISGNILTESFRVIDYENNAVKIFTKEEYQNYKRENVLKEIEKWVKEK